MKEIVIPKERAVFWLDKNGCWTNVHGRFRHKKIIDHFNAAIRKDGDGYYVTQMNGDRREKVYFRYEDTALFVTDVIKDNEITLTLNTGEKIRLVPEDLFVKGDNLYLHRGDEQIKFNERSLLKLSGVIEYENECYFIRVGGRRYQISSD